MICARAVRSEEPCEVERERGGGGGGGGREGGRERGRGRGRVVEGTSEGDTCTVYMYGRGE